jgi:succinate dehydrogenase flavin-adding protein (antitoxin of CptAB toxin-antitoxin module)
MRKTINNLDREERTKISKFLEKNDNELAVPVSQYP